MKHTLRGSAARGRTSCFPRRAAALLVGMAVATSGTALPPNPDFEAGGEGAPLGWRLTTEAQGAGAWMRTEGVDGSAALMVEGDGASSHAWVTADPILFESGRLYRFSFQTRGDQAVGGTAVSGPAFANVDLGPPDAAWRRHSHIFVAPFRENGLSEPLRLGQWQTRGRIFFDNARLVAVEAAHQPFESGELGAGERIQGSRYFFEPVFGQDGRNHSRPHVRHTAAFNSDRWVFDAGAFVLYRQRVAGRRFLNGNLALTSYHHVSGSVLIEASADAETWLAVGALTNAGHLSQALPASLFPAAAIYVRLRADHGTTMQIHAYAFQGDIEGEPVNAIGETRYFEAEHYHERIRAQIRDFGSLLPREGQAVTLRIQSRLPAPVETAARVLFVNADTGLARTNLTALTIPGAGIYDLTLPYDAPGIGLWEMNVAVSNVFVARLQVRIPDFFDDRYGERLPSPDERLDLWRASSGWKIPRYRALPRQPARTLAVRLARNEREATQLVVTPQAALTNLQVTVSDLFSGGNRLPRERVEILRVGYVPVTQPTDFMGAKADWPDPLLPQDAPATLAPGRHQPFWIRVYAPGETPPGIYQGTVTVQADGLRVTVPLSVEVYDFALPRVMTCETAFGFNPHMVWRYHGVIDPAQRRHVLDLYLQALSDARVSPYNPVPMDPWRVEWKGMSPWEGGTLDPEVNVEGAASLFIEDACETTNVSAAYDRFFALPKKGFRIAFQHKTNQGQPFLMSMGFWREDGTWMSGRNADFSIPGATTWQRFETVHDAFPDGATRARFRFLAAGYQESGSATGGLWMNGLSIVDLDTGRELIAEHAFTPPDFNAFVPVFDFTAWDAAMTRAFEKYRFNTFMIPVEGLGGGSFHQRYEPRFLGFDEQHPAYDLLLGRYLGGIERHLREKGWLDKGYVYWFDEPEPRDYEFVMKGFNKLRRHAPGLRRMLTEQVEPELVGGPNLWTPLTPFLNTPGLEERRAAGDQFWWYVCTVPKAPYATLFVDHPGTALRVWLWQTWAERVSGILIWETVYWTSDEAYPDPARPQNPYLDPMAWVSGYGVEPGGRLPWGNGDGRFLYPPLAAADGRPAAPTLEGPVGSVRLEMLRDGIEDYEYFAILRRLLNEKGGALDARSRAGLEALLVVPAEVSSGLTTFTRDPAPLEAHRDRLARAIVDLLKR